MPVTWRKTAIADLGQALLIRRVHRGEALVGPDAALQVWKSLVSASSFVSAVFESDPPIRGHKLVAFGASVMVSPAFMDDATAHPRPGINSRLFAAIHSGQPVALTRDQIAVANAGNGVDIVTLQASWKEEILDPLESASLQTALASAFVALHAGYRVRRLAWESSCPAELRFSQLSGAAKTIAEFSGGHALHFVDHPSAAAEVASLPSVVFQYREPVLRLREADQQLLVAALSGATDEELGAELGLTVFAVKARWRSAFSRIAGVKPGLVEDVNGLGGRGGQKRHRVVAYLREHPEELRPYAWKRRS
jgi:hypothetical protein